VILRWLGWVGEPFKIAFGPGRITGSFDLTDQEAADKMIEVLGAMKMFLGKKEAAN
jgi:hypothetical protein